MIAPVCCAKTHTVCWHCWRDFGRFWGSGWLTDPFKLWNCNSFTKFAEIKSVGKWWDMKNIGWTTISHVTQSQNSSKKQKVALLVCPSLQRIKTPDNPSSEPPSNNPIGTGRETSKFLVGYIQAWICCWIQSFLIGPLFLLLSKKFLLEFL